jgi:homeodomain interacting protein kinase
VTNFVPNTAENMTFTINNQLSNQVQRLVRERSGPTTYDNLYQIYGRRQYSNARSDAFQHQLVSSILCQPGYQTMPSPTKHVVAMQPPLPPQQYVNVPVPVSMVEPTNQRMLLTNATVQSSVAWPQGGRSVAIAWPHQPTGPHSLIVDSAPFLNVEDIYPKHQLNMVAAPPRHEPKKESPVHHLM